MKKTSLQDIAQSLKVSKTLVSMVLNGHGDQNGISPQTQKRVLDKAQELNYKPNRMARGLRTGKSHTIGLIVSNISNPFYASLCRVIEDVLSAKGYNLMICSSDENPDKEKELVSMLLDRQVDGLILSPSREKADGLDEVVKSGLPLVLIDRYLEDVKADSVTVDNYRGAYRATEELLRSGSKRIGHISITPAYLSTLRDRKQGFFDALKAHEIEGATDLVCEIPFGEDKAGVEQIIQKWLGANPDIDGLFLANNSLTIDALHSLRKMGKQIPTDMQVVCFDDRELFDLMTPTISALSQPLDEMGRKAAELLVRRVDNPQGNFDIENAVLPVTLVSRESCLVPQHENVNPNP